MADAKRTEIRDDSRGVAKREMPVKLHAVGRRWYLILPLHDWNGLIRRLALGT